MAPVAAGMFEHGDELRRITEQMRAAMEPSRRMQEQLAAISKAYTSPILDMQIQIAAMNQSIFEPYRQMQENFRRQAEKINEPFRRMQEQAEKFNEPFRRMREQVEKINEPFRRMQEQAEKFNEPFRRLQEQTRQMTEPLLRMREQLEPLLQMHSRYASSLEDYNPTFESVDDGFVVDGNTYTVDDVNNAVSGMNKLGSKWDSLPKPLQWLIIVLLTFLLQDVYDLCKDWVRSQVPVILHLQKQEVKVIKQQIKESAANDISPFISQDHIAVYCSPKRRSRLVTCLPFKTEVTVLKHRKKKRWLLVKWEADEQTHCGWVLGRHVFRPSKYRRAN